MEAAREIRGRYEDQLPEVTMSVRINQIITDVPFGEGQIAAYVDTSEGSLALELGELDEPDAVMMVDYHTAHAIIVERDPAVVMQSFLQGRIRVQGDMMKLMAMQAAAGADPDDELADATRRRGPRDHDPARADRVRVRRRVGRRRRRRLTLGSAAVSASILRGSASWWPPTRRSGTSRGS